MIPTHSSTHRQKAIRQLLERPPQKEDMERWRQHLAKPRAVVPKYEVFLTFSIESYSFALPLNTASKVSNATVCRPIPYRTHPCFLGVTNIKGQVELAFSLLHLFKPNAPRISQPEPTSQWIHSCGSYVFLQLFLWIRCRVFCTPSPLS